MNSDINSINELIKNNPHFSEKIKSMSENDLKNAIKGINKAEIATKLRAMGLASMSEKVMNISNAEIINAITQNPDILKKIKRFL